MLLVLVRQYDAIRRNSPVDPQGGIVPRNTTVTVRCVIVGNLVDDLAIRLQRHIAMSKAGRDPELMPVLRRQLDGDMAAKGRRTDPNIHANVEDRASRASHELALSV